MPKGEPSSEPLVINWRLYPKYTGYMPHEPLERYAPGGFHPVSLGDTLQDGRYTIRLKLGYGGQSTVWLVWDAYHELETGAWVAIKIKSARASEKGLDADTEIGVLRKLEQYYLSQTQTQTRPFIQLFDTFQHTGPNGVHTCIVTEVLGPTLANILQDYPPEEDTLPPSVILRVSQQLLHGLEFAHAAGIAHGDVYPGNISFTWKTALADADNDLIEMMGGEPMTVPYESDAERPHSLPQQLIACTMFDDWYFDPSEDIRLIDWGWSFPVDETVTVLGQPSNLRPPETFFVHTFTYKQNLWRAGSVIYTLFYQKSPFSFFADPDHFFIRRLVAKLGPLPAPWHKKWEDMLVDYKYVNEDVMPQKLIQDTFEPRWQQIVANILKSDKDGDEYHNEKADKNNDEDGRDYSDKGITDERH
ncbi:hypothetical protein Sste5346_009195 [Sporothrix stenoceras]|uniref:non-specific serine/threonine protein kinase n=1 Tax=Sporothrix stenoceras TaxID=5173 RepID=A0ABR3YKZ1_9PEZI